MTNLTRTQLDALAHLHRTSQQWPLSRARHMGNMHDDVTRYSRRTLDALVTAGVARWADRTPGVMPHVVPVLRTWADGTGTWHAEVPRTLFDGLKGGARATARRQIARAALTGEIWARSGQSYIDDWRPRVAPYGPVSSSITYREA